MRSEMLFEQYTIGAGPAAPPANPSGTGEPSGTGGNNDGNPPSSQPSNQPTSTPDQAAAEVSKAYGKLREVESERDNLKKQVKDKDTQLSELDTTKQTNQQLTEENGKLRNQLQEFAVSGTARDLGYAAPQFALSALKQSGKIKDEKDYTDATKVRSALEDLARETPGLVAGTGGLPPSPPSGGTINPGGPAPTGGGNAAINSAIRQAAGRRA